MGWALGPYQLQLAKAAVGGSEILFSLRWVWSAGPGPCC